MPKEKREWLKPKLIILIRGKPEERTLDACKLAKFVGGAGPAVVAGHCYQPAPCQSCATLGS